MQRDQALGPAQALGQHVEIEPGSPGGEQELGVVAVARLDLAEHRTLGLHVLGHQLEHQIRRRGRQLFDEANAGV